MVWNQKSKGNGVRVFLAEDNRYDDSHDCHDGKAFEEDKQNALEAGMKGHPAKPIEIPKRMEALL